jgi:hypothetical protein
MKRILFFTAVLLSTSAMADDQAELDSAFRSITYAYAHIRVPAYNCGFSAGEWISFKARVLETLSQGPEIDVMRADRDMDRFYEEEKSRMSPQCNEPQREMYQRAVDNMDRHIDRLRGLVSKRR